MKCNFPKGWLHLAARHRQNMQWEMLRYYKDSQGWPLPCRSSKAHCPPSCPVGLTLLTPPHWPYPRVRGNKRGWEKIILAIDMGSCERINCFLLTCGSNELNRLMKTSPQSLAPWSAAFKLPPKDLPFLILIPLCNHLFSTVDVT